MLFGKVVGQRRLDIDDSDQPVLVDQWNGQLGADLWNGRNVTWILGNVIDQDGFPPLGCDPSDTFAYFDSQAIGNFPGVSDLESETQFLGFFIQQQDAKDFVIDNLAYELR